MPGNPNAVFISGIGRSIGRGILPIAPLAVVFYSWTALTILLVGKHRLTLTISLFGKEKELLIFLNNRADFLYKRDETCGTY